MSPARSSVSARSWDAETAPLARYASSMRLHFLSLLMAGATSLLVCCSHAAAGEKNPAGAKTTVTQTIGPEGGKIELDGATVTFPAGAIASATSITIAATDEAAPSGYKALSRIYKCEPTGL